MGVDTRMKMRSLVSDTRSLSWVLLDVMLILTYIELSAAMKLPVELLQQVYQHLSPVDFDSARHTCRV